MTNDREREDDADRMDRERGNGREVNKKKRMK